MQYQQPAEAGPLEDETPCTCRHFDGQHRLDGRCSVWPCVCRAFVDLNDVPAVVVACGRLKAREPARARLLYRGPYFASAIGWALSVAGPARTYILSAKYGLIDCDAVIEPYDVRFPEHAPDHPQAGRNGEVTAAQVQAQARDLGLARARHVYFAGGSAYLGFLRSAIPRVVPVTAALEPGRRGLGYQRQWFATHRGETP